MNRDKFTNEELVLNVGNGHKIYVVDWGNKEVKTPVIYLHGGPGGSIKDSDKQIFNPEEQRVIFFDQRGCGKSTPYGSLNNNTTEDLAQDITRIAKHLKIDKFHLDGYSWGSTLALYYAITRPEMVVSVIIGGVFSGSSVEINDMYEMGRKFYPDLWDKVLSDTPEEFHDDPTKYHINKGLNGNEREQKKSVYVMEHLESGVCSFNDMMLPKDFEKYDPAGMRIELHYIANKCFMENNYILDNAHKIKVPVYIIQGRFDMICTPEFAYKISRIIPNSKLYWTISNHMPDHEISQIYRTIFDMLT